MLIHTFLHYTYCSRRFFEVLRSYNGLVETETGFVGNLHTFKMEKNIRLIVLEHLRHKLNVHILDVDFLQRVNIIIYHIAFTEV